MYKKFLQVNRQSTNDKWAADAQTMYDILARVSRQWANDILPISDSEASFYRY